VDLGIVCGAFEHCPLFSGGKNLHLSLKPLLLRFKHMPAFVTKAKCFYKVIAENKKPESVQASSP
jgi:hypothetical protein